jgi:AraC-like DNA-binding protein
MSVLIKIMRNEGEKPRPGAHNSNGMNPDAVWHMHDLHQLLYAFEGSVHIESGQSRFLAPPQMAVFIPAGVTHRTRIQAQRSGSVFLPPSWIKSAGSRMRILRAPGLMREMVLEAMRWQIHEPEDAIGRAYFKGFAALCGEWIENEAPLHLPTADDPKLKKALDYTQAHLADARFEDVCRAANLSERSLRRRFTEMLGMSWIEYRHRARLLKAITLLDDKTSAVSDVAATVGFDSVSAFSKAFSAFAGMSPRIYRNQHG